MSKIINVCGSDDYKLMIDFEDGSNIIFNMQKLVKSIPYSRLTDHADFQAVKFDGKSIYWNTGDGKPEYFPLSLSIDTILFSFRE